MKYMEVIHCIDSVTATTTSEAISIEGAVRVTIVVQRSDHSSGSTALTVDVSPDATNWIAYDKLIDNVTNTNGQNLTRVTTKTLSADGIDFVSMDTTTDCLPWLRVKATETTDGTHDVWVIIQR